jgi:hypothetical protein
LQLEGDDASLIAGKVVEGALDDLEQLFGRTCTARIQVRDARLPSGETREAHTLMYLSE